MENVARAYAEQAGYVFERQVGVGAFKETFLVYDDLVPLALKVLGSNCSTVRTVREIDALTRCSHANIAKLRSVDEFLHEGKTHICLVEDYLAGGTLGSRLTSGLLARTDVISLSLGLVGALDHLYGLGLVHRDVKPENIMYEVAESDEPVLVDFGLVRDLAASSITQTWFAQGPGTPLFAAPEQLNNSKELIDWRTDQFAVGVTLSFALLGYHPYSAQTDTAYECVDRVAALSNPSVRFSEEVVRAGFPVLAQMVSPYPVQRVRTPQKLSTILRSY